jgi:hypothetical protein
MSGGGHLKACRALGERHGLRLEHQGGDGEGGRSQVGPLPAGAPHPGGAEGRAALKLAPFQRQFVACALAPETQTAVIGIGRGNAKSRSRPASQWCILLRCGTATASRACSTAPRGGASRSSKSCSPIRAIRVRRRPRPPPEAARDRVPGCPAGRASPSCRGAGSSSAPSLGSGATDGWRRCRASRSIRRSHYLPRHDQGDPMASLQKPNLPAQTLTPPVRAPRRRPPAGWPVPPRSAEHLPPAPRRHSRGHGPPRCGRSRPPARS